MKIFQKKNSVKTGAMGCMDPVNKFLNEMETAWHTAVQRVLPQRTEEETDAQKRLRTIHRIWSYSETMMQTVQAYADKKIMDYNQEKHHRVYRRELVMKDGCTLSGVEFTHAQYTKHIVAFLGTQQYAEYSVDTR